MMAFITFFFILTAHSLFLGTANGKPEFESALKHSERRSRTEVPIIPDQEKVDKVLASFPRIRGRRDLTEKRNVEYPTQATYSSEGGISYPDRVIENPGPYVPNLDEDSSGREFRRDEFMRMKKLLSLSNLDHYYSNYGNGKRRVAAPSHFFKEWENGDGESNESPSDSKGRNRNLYSDSVNQLLRNIYEHQGMRLNEARGDPIMGPNLEHSQGIPNWDSWTSPSAAKENKRSSSDSRLMCHFKLCQLGSQSSGKRYDSSNRYRQP